MKFKLNRFVWISILFLSLSIILYSNITWTDFPQGQNIPFVEDVEKEGNPKMESVLYRLMNTYFEEGMEEAKEFAQQRDVGMKGDQVRVVAHAKAQSAGNKLRIRTYTLRKQIESLGGTVELTHQNLIQSLLPLHSLQDFANLDSVKYLRLPKKAIPLVESEGVQTTNAVQWQNISQYRSTEKVKVCVLDAGFKGYENLLGTDLPEKVTTKSFRADGNLYAHKHGTACAEIVHDMVPHAELYLVNFNTSVEQHNAVDWIIDQGIDIVSFSMGYFNMGAGNGTGPVCRDIKRAKNKGIVWVSAAGNYAKYHWEGIFNDPDNDTLHNFPGAQGLPTDELLVFYVPANTPVSAYLNWNDWGSWNGTTYQGSNQDYDLYLYFWNGSNWSNVAQSMNIQSGFQWPVESISGWYSQQSTWWGVAINRYSAARNVKLELFIKGTSQEILYNKKFGSLSIPADSPDGITVGATDWFDDSLHSYSSRGPTTDKRKKPDFSAPAGVSGVTYGNLGFYGTSASTPHVAGAFALLKGKTPYSLEQIKMILESRAKDLGPNGKDNQFGIGRLDLKK
ncbi:S8 family serine peptidase [bacterium]|nr:S8 family serine peptidase [bacterium]